MTDYRDVDVDQDHMLKDFAGIYDSFSEMMVTEPMANGLDISATEMKIRLFTDKDGKQSYYRMKKPGTMTVMNVPERELKKYQRMGYEIIEQLS